MYLLGSGDVCRVEKFVTIQARLDGHRASEFQGPRVRQKARSKHGSKRSQNLYGSQKPFEYLTTVNAYLGKAKRWPSLSTAQK